MSDGRPSKLNRISDAGKAFDLDPALKLLPAIDRADAGATPMPRPEMPPVLPQQLPEAEVPAQPMPERRREYFSPAYAESFACIGSACEDTCCTGWGVPIDQPTFEKYRANETMSSHVGKLIVLNAQPNRYDYARIPMTVEKACPFLDEQRLCGIQKTLGPEMLSHTCATYPRVHSVSAGQAEKMLNLSCPEATRLVLLNDSLLGKGPWAADTMQRYASIRHDLWHAPLNYQPRLALREFVLLLVTDRSYPLWQRLYLLGVFAQRLDRLSGSAKVGEWCDQNPEVVMRSLGDSARVVANSHLRAKMNRSEANPGLQLQLLCEILQQRVSAPPVSERLIECVREFESGIAASSAKSGAEVLERYKSNYALYYKPLLQKHPHLMENFLINLVLKSGFPFGRRTPESANMGIDEQKLEVQNEVLQLCVQVGLAQTLLVGIAGHYRENFCETHVVKLIQSLAKTFDHSQQALDRISAFVAAKNLKDPMGIALLLQHNEPLEQPHVISAREGLLDAARLDTAHQMEHVFDRGSRNDAMSKIEDVPGTAIGQRENLVDASIEHFLGGEQGDGIEISLYGTSRPNGAPAFVEWNAPVQANHVGSGFSHGWQQRGRIHAEVNYRNSQGSHTLH